MRTHEPAETDFLFNEVHYRLHYRWILGKRWVFKFYSSKQQKSFQVSSVAAAAAE